MACACVRARSAARTSTSRVTRPSCAAVTRSPVGSESAGRDNKWRYAVAPRFKERYRTEVVPALMERFGYDNVHEVPELDKIVVNMGVGGATQDAKLLESAMNDLTIVTGQKPAVTRAKKSIASFKLRQGMAIGCKVTLRGDRMWEFFDRLLSTALPRIRDFRGVSATAFDGRGNYSLGVTEQLIFPEIDYDKVDKIRGMDITFVTTAKTDEECRVLLEQFGFPFKK
ncbi:MAG: 50S ribosomal protein L5 [Actinobacteria bacterium]|nr:50S ribosomal protein L5 [Actinomycetota bacterium]